tara:strand:+ start:1092 stop:1535 length:444 start_codon:yes stop_codon:yes gene_type:complete
MPFLKVLRALLAELGKKHSRYIWQTAPSQGAGNVVDCGLFVLLFAHHVCKSNDQAVLKYSNTIANRKPGKVYSKEPPRNIKFTDEMTRGFLSAAVVHRWRQYFFSSILSVPRLQRNFGYYRDNYLFKWYIETKEKSSKTALVLAEDD